MAMSLMIQHKNFWDFAVLSVYGTFLTEGQQAGSLFGDHGAELLKSKRHFCLRNFTFLYLL